MKKSGVGEFAFGLGDGAVEGAGGFDPLGEDGWRSAEWTVSSDQR